jgi:ATP-dependent Clp protease ATP-binding subunit ClpB
MFNVSDGEIQHALREAGLTREKVMQALTSIRGAQRVTDANPEEKYQALEKYGRNLTQLAVQGKLDPVIGRDEEIRRVIQVLSRRTKNNPVLLRKVREDLSHWSDQVQPRWKADVVQPSRRSQ